MQYGEPVELIDENGDTVQFEHLMTVEYNGDSYILLGLDSDDDDVTDVVIMRIAKDKDGSDIYLSDLSEETHQAVFNLAQELMDEDDYDGDGDDHGDG
ncbi:MAG: DUF1292 domain-containing protein [Oscillospiraceae bacterium]|nr:DUF1292 domain-containing protein [Oscillospiraceae bacterium]